MYNHSSYIWFLIYFDFFFRLLFSSCLNWKIYCDNNSSLSCTTTVHIIMNYFVYTSHHFILTGRYELNKLTSLPMCGLIAQLVEHRTGIAEVTGSNPVEALIIFFRLLLSNCLNWKIYCDDHSSLSCTIAVHIWIILYTHHIISFSREDMNSINWPRSQCVAW